jgi:hypothetical protein
MTKASSVNGVPLPDDAATYGDYGAYTTKVGGPAELTAFYKDYMTGHGWTFDSANSVMDQDHAVATGLGPIPQAFYCKGEGSNIQTVAVTIGTAKEGPTEVIVQDDPGETSCP